MAEAVSQEEMERVYHEVKTPFKVGVVLKPDKGMQIDNPTVFRWGEVWRMLYIQYDNAGYETHMAESSDLIHWRKLGCVLPRGPSGAWDQAQADGGPALFSTTWGENTLEKWNDKYWMTYIGGEKTGYETAPLSIGVAWTESLDEAHVWTKSPEPVLEPSDSDARSFEDYELFRSFVLHDRAMSLGSEFVMFYNAKRRIDKGESIGMALSDDMIHWRRYGKEPVVTNGAPKERGIGIVADPMVTRIGDLWVMFYFSAFWPKSDTPAHETFACSRDLVQWTKWKGSPLVEPSTGFDANHAHKPWVICHNGVVYHFYCAVGDQGRVLALATSRPIEKRISLSETTEMFLEPSNNARGTKRVAFSIVGKTNYVFDANGAGFIFENGVFPFVAKDCQDITLKNIFMRNEHVGLVQFKVVSKDDNGFTVRIETDSPYRVANGDIDFMMPDGKWKPIRVFSFHSLDRMLIRYVFSATGCGDKDALAANFMATFVRAVGPGLIRFDYRPDFHAKSEKCVFELGESISFGLGLGRECIGLYFENCKNVTVENVTLSRFVGMGLVAQLCSNVIIRTYSTRPFGSDRVTTTADDMMFTSCEGDILVENCAIQDSQDDGCNVHGNYHVVSNVDGARVKVRAMHFEQRGFFPYRTGDSIDLISTNDCAILGSARVVRFVSRDEPGVFATIELDREIPPSSVGMLVENTSLEPNVTLRNNTFVNVPHIRLSGRGKIVVENNVFRRLTGGLLATDLIDYWYEYGRITDMRIVGNVFDGILRPFRSGVNRWQYGDVSVPKIHGRILFCDNVFTNCSPSGVSINGFKEVVWRDAQ